MPARAPRSGLPWDSAEGQVQNLQYTAAFPLLLNISDQPTYFMALKDGSRSCEKVRYGQRPEVSECGDRRYGPGM